MFVHKNLLRESIMAVVNLMNWTVYLGEGDIGVCVWFGAPMMHNMFGISLA